MSDQATLPAGVTHGAMRLPSVTVESYAVEIRDDDGFVGDRANKGAFRDLLHKWRQVARCGGDDPFGNTETAKLEKQELDKVLAEGDPKAVAVLQSAIEEFAQEFASVIKRFLKLKAWRDAERLVIGGGFSGRRGSGNWPWREPASCSRPIKSTLISRSSATIAKRTLYQPRKQRPQLTALRDWCWYLTFTANISSPPT
jgi:hypothetical protein